MTKEDVRRAAGSVPHSDEWAAGAYGWSFTPKVRGTFRIYAYVEPMPDSRDAGTAWRCFKVK